MSEFVDEKNWIDKMLELYKSGRSDLEVIRDLKISRRQFEEYMRVAEFRDVVEAGRDLAEAWWLEQGREGTQFKGRKDAAFWQANMQNRFGWANKTDTRAAQITVDNLSVEQMRQILQTQLPALLKDPVLSAALIEAKDGEKTE